VNVHIIIAVTLVPVEVIVQLRPVEIVVRLATECIAALVAVAVAVRQSIVAADCTSATANVTRHVPRDLSLVAGKPAVFALRLAAKD
jgi:hypothetical protein